MDNSSISLPTAIPNCSMWVTEGAMPEKKDNKKTVFNLRAGDVILYYTNNKYSNDYIGAIY